MWLPRGVKRWMKKPSARKTSSSRSDRGMPPTAPLPMNTKRSGKPPIELPPLMVKARPWLIWPTTRVVMKAGTASLDTIRPLNRPMAIPASMPARHARREVDPGEHEHAADHWAERQQTGQGQVDPLDDDDERHPHRADADDGRLPDDVEQVRQVQEVRDLGTQGKEGCDGDQEGQSPPRRGSDIHNLRTPTCGLRPGWSCRRPWCRS